MPLSTSQEIGASAVFPALTNFVPADGIEQVDLAAPDARDEVWRSVRESAQALCAREPLMRPRLDEQILSPETPCDIVAVLLAARMATKALHETPLRELMRETLMAHPAILRRIEADLHAIVERDPACPGALHALLNLKGFHALQVHRIAHVLWHQGRWELALTLANQASVVFTVDIHPAARIGAGVMLDHGSGIVVGETAVIEDNVSILQNVTLGGTGKEHGDRHPKIRAGVMIGAGAKILGNIEVGSMSKVAAGSVVLRNVPPYCTVAGIPARIVRYHMRGSYPSFDMDQML